MEFPSAEIQRFAPWQILLDCLINPIFIPLSDRLKSLLIIYFLCAVPDPAISFSDSLCYLEVSM